ncbi:spermine synthase [Candidatus Poribacteria bacterium]
MGFSGLVAQMLLLRELLVVFSGNELSIGIVLANWLILEASGCFFLSKKAESARNKIEIFGGIIILFSLSLPTAVYLTRILKTIMGISIGESIGLLPILYSSFLILLPVSVSHGALFTFSCKIYSIFFAGNASSIGKVYVYETIGTIFGGIVWAYLLIPYLHAFQMAVGLAMLNFLVLLVLLAHYWKLGRLQKTVTVISGLLLVFSGYMFFTDGADKLHHRSISAQWKDHDIVHYQNSIYGNTCVVKSGEQYIFFSDGIPNLITPIPDIEFVEKFVHLPLLAHPNPKRLLILSGGAGGVIDEILKHPSVELLEYAELDPLFLDLIRKFPTPLTENELTHRKVKVKHIDGRLLLKITQNKYDLILVGLLNPSDLQTNRFFTEEFFSLARRKLNEDGILVIGLPGSLSYLNDELKNLNGCIFNTLKSVFPYVRVFPGDGTNLFLSSNSEEVSLIDRTRLINRLDERDVKVDILVPRHIEKKLHPRWQNWFLGFLEGSTRKINRDFKPLGMYYSISHWNALFAPYFRGLFRWFEKIDLWMFFVLFVFFIAIFFLLRSRNVELFGSGIPLCIATTGFAGMIFDLALIFTFQSIYGYVFSWIGLLVTSFMAGAAIGAMIITSLLSRIKDCLRLLINTDLAIICFSLGLPFTLLVLHPYLGSPGVFLFLKVLFLIISFISGFLIGAQFPLANKIYLKDDTSLSKTAGILYSSDLLGGWLGGVVGGVILLPVLGLLGSCVVVVLLKLFSFIIITTHAHTAV